MRQLIGFVPKHSTTALHERTKNLTGNITAIENDTVSVNFMIIENDKEALVSLKYPLNECKDYFVSQDPTRKNGMTFHEFCRELNGFNVYIKGSEVPKWMLFWNGITTSDIFTKKYGMSYESRPIAFSVN